MRIFISVWFIILCNSICVDVVPSDESNMLLSDFTKEKRNIIEKLEVSKTKFNEVVQNMLDDKNFQNKKEELQQLNLFYENNIRKIIKLITTSECQEAK